MTLELALECIFLILSLILVIVTLIHTTHVAIQNYIQDINLILRK